MKTVVNEYQYACADLVFATAGDFQSWRTSQTFQADSLDKYETECACVTLYLNALIQTPNSMVFFPIRLKRSESPDFVLSFGDNMQIGIEHSTITSTKYQQLRAESMRNPKEQIVWLDAFKIGGPPDKEINQGWVGDEPEREWATLAFDRIKEKFSKLNRSHFKKCMRNELLLNTVSYLPNLKIEVAIKMLRPQLTEEAADGKYESLFDSISFIYGRWTIPHALTK